MLRAREQEGERSHPRAMKRINQRSWLLVVGSDLCSPLPAPSVRGWPMLFGEKKEQGCVLGACGGVKYIVTH